MTDITVQELKEKKDQGDSFVLIDVREPNERAAFNIGGEFIPLGTLSSAAADLEDKKNEEVIVYCRSGGRSGRAQNMLRQAGFTNVRNLEGGILAWIDAFGDDASSSS